MKLAQQLRERNIAEYLIYMWQVEDLLRANKFDLDSMEDSIISRYADDEKTEVREWYENLIDMMRDEGVMEHGHLQIHKNVIIQLTDLHNELIELTKFHSYTLANLQEFT